MSSDLKDIRKFTSINNSKEFCLDTNVLYWYTYPRYNLQTTNGTIRRSQPYYDFVDKLVADGNPLLTTRYNISELINVIENHEYEIFKKLHPEADYTKKDYRRIPKERESLKKILNTTLSNVNSVCNIADFNFTEQILVNCVNTLDKHRCDVFDFAILSYYKANNHLNIITDDSDFSSVDGIHLFTANDISLSL